MTVSYASSQGQIQGAPLLIFPIQIAPSKWLEPCPPLIEENPADPPPPPLKFLYSGFPTKDHTRVNDLATTTWNIARKKEISKSANPTTTTIVHTHSVCYSSTQFPLSTMQKKNPTTMNCATSERRAHVANTVHHCVENKII